MEKLKPLKNLGGGIRRIFDLQVASVYRGIFPLIKRAGANGKGKVVDVGCGASPYKHLFEGWEYEGLDIQDSEEQFDYSNKNVTYYDGSVFPENTESAKLVFHSEVIEHVFDTAHFLSECHRILETGGCMIFTVPFQARYHYIPYDYWRFTPSSLQIYLEKAGFEKICIIPRSRDICVAAYKTLTIGYRLFFSGSWWRIILAVFFAPIWILSLIIGQVSLHLNLGSEDDCLGYIIACEKRSVQRCD